MLQANYCTSQRKHHSKAPYSIAFSRHNIYVKSANDPVETSPANLYPFFQFCVLASAFTSCLCLVQDTLGHTIARVLGLQMGWAGMPAMRPLQADILGAHTRLVQVAQLDMLAVHMEDTTGLQVAVDNMQSEVLRHTGVDSRKDMG